MQTFSRSGTKHAPPRRSGSKSNHISAHTFVCPLINSAKMGLLPVMPRGTDVSQYFLSKLIISVGNYRCGRVTFAPECYHFLLKIWTQTDKNKLSLRKVLPYYSLKYDENPFQRPIWRNRILMYAAFIKSIWILQGYY